MELKTLGKPLRAANDAVGKAIETHAYSKARNASVRGAESEQGPIKPIVDLLVSDQRPLSPRVLARIAPIGLAVTGIITNHPDLTAAGLTAGSMAYADSRYDGRRAAGYSRALLDTLDPTRHAVPGGTPRLLKLGNAFVAVPNGAVAVELNLAKNSLIWADAQGEIHPLPPDTLVISHDGRTLSAQDVVDSVDA